MPRLHLVAKRSQQLPEPVPLHVDAYSIAAFVAKLLAEAKVRPSQRPQCLIRRLRPALALGCRFPPANGRALDVPRQQLGKVVMAVELVLVLNADVGGGHGRL